MLGVGAEAGVAAGTGVQRSGAAREVCRTWSYCSDRKKCGQQYRSCVLKYAPNVTRLDTSSSGPGVEGVWAFDGW